MTWKLYDPETWALGQYDARGWPAFRSGEIIATAELVDAHPDAGCCEPWGEHSYRRADGTLVAHPTHLVFEDVEPVALRESVQGRLGLWRLPHDIARAIHLKEARL